MNIDPIGKALTDWAPERKQVRIKLGLLEVLAQLAEEGAELSQTALKMRRALDGTNPTPVTLEEAERQLQEEFADVLLCMSIIGADEPAVEQAIRYKIARWVDRLNGEGVE